MELGGFLLSPQRPYVLAELSCNHAGRLDLALDLIRAAHAAGADGVKFQHYTAAGMGHPDRPITEGPWAGQTQGALYAAAAMPWEWTDALVAECNALGLSWCSSVYDAAGVAFLEPYAPMAYKVASFELTDHELLAAVAATKRPILLSTGMATLGEITAALEAIEDVSRETRVCVLHCVSAYPTPVEAANLRRIVALQDLTWGGPIGFSDHTLGHAAACGAVALGACLLEKHLKLDDDRYGTPTADAAFSQTPAAFRDYVAAVKGVGAALRASESDVEAASRQFRRATGGARGDYAPS